MTEEADAPAVDHNLYYADPENITREMVRAFLDHQQRERLFTESTTLEFKRERTGFKIAEAVCAMANTEGGLILVGIDEDNPSEMPGVPRSEYESVSDQCLNVLEPRWTPIIVAVPADDDERVVLVIRVDQELVPLRPMFCRQRAYLRAPGATVRANREQLFALVDNRARANAAPALQHSATFTGANAPPQRTGQTERDATLPALCLRANGGIWLRPSSTAQLVLGSAMRNDIERAIDASDLCAWAGGHAVIDNADGWQVISSRSSWWEARRRLARKFPPVVDLHVQAQVQGQYVSYYVDVEIREHVTSTGVDGGQMRLYDVLDGLFRLIKLVTIDLPQTIAARVVTPALRREATTAWLHPREQRLHQFLMLDEYDHFDVADDQRVSTAHMVTAAGTSDEIRADLQARLVELLFDDGIRNPEVLAEQLINGIPEAVDPKPCV
jgi:hypothetical protein